MTYRSSRRSFLQWAGLGAAAVGIGASARGDEQEKIQGFEQQERQPGADQEWQPTSDRKIRMGIVGFGLCQFGAAFSLQDHPNVEVVAVSDLFPDRCQALAKACRCEKTYPSLEEMVKDDQIEAIFVATDAPSHARHCMDVLAHGKHVATAVPAVFEHVELADELYAAVKKSGLKYMMFETSCYHDDLYAMREIYRAGGFGKLVYSEGEYYHYGVGVLDSYKGWRIGLPPQFYPTHSNAYYCGVSGGSFLEVSCMGMPSILPELQPENNRYRNPFGTEIASFRTSEGGMARMAVSWDTPGYGGEVGRVRGQRGSMVGMSYQGLEEKLPDLARPPLPPSVALGGHGGSHGYLGHEFVTSILENRQPLIDVSWALNMSLSGIIAHQSALKDGQLMKIPQYAPLEA
ncbi:MAG: Gfo/Idh/MocA family oxidoreductase [Planctomycetaceae bacterium]|nr:Gfo/Idh/MocA family oxidoreductase [Planctomycetaceae bacterium]